MLKQLIGEYLTIEDCARELGISRQAARYRIFGRGIPVEHVGRTPLVHRKDLVKLEGDLRKTRERWW
jgi:hypothetical protein